MPNELLRHVLQNRWRVVKADGSSHLLYYGVRNPPHHRTVFMPQSIVEMGAAVFFGLTSRNDALKAVEELGYWKPPAILDKLADDLGLTSDAVRAANDELTISMAEWASMKGKDEV
ncbi:MAG: hypothetical protein KFF50_11710 [Desulfatitalea sp.]|nr:hypothetical protein [Desulfatitalea sp.]